MTKQKFLQEIKNDFEKTKSDEALNQGQKNSKYAGLMTLMEQRFKIPLLAGAKFDQLDNDVKDLYLDISFQRNFDIYELEELEAEKLLYSLDASDIQRAKVIFPNLENETTELLELMLLEIRGRDWSTLEKSTILKHDYIQSILIKRERR